MCQDAHSSLLPVFPGTALQETFQGKKSFKEAKDSKRLSFEEAKFEEAIFRSIQTTS
jgi:hypothetical protein